MNHLPLPAWFLRWLSVDVDSLEGGSAHLRFARFPEGELGLLTLLAIGLAFAVVVAIYFREGTIPTWRKMGLALLRCALIAVTAIIVFYPVLEVNRSRDLKATTLVLLDDSMSMGIKDRYQSTPEFRKQLSDMLGVEAGALQDVRRSDIVTHAIEDDASAFLRDLRANNLLKVYTFSDQLRPIASAETPTAPPASGPESATATDAPETPREPPLPKVKLEPQGTVTDLAGALRGAVEQQGGTRIAAVVVLGDGRLTAGEGVTGVGEFLRKKSIPVHTVGVGDPTPPRNFRLMTVLTNERVFTGDPITVDVRLRQQGYDNETVQIELIDQFLAAGGETVSEKHLETADLTFGDEQNEGAAHFTVKLEGLGRHRLTARVAARAEEAFADDNARSVDVEVIEDASRVLFIAGAPSWEYRFLKNLLRRDKRVFLAAWLMSADPDYPQEGNTSLDTLPKDAKELFEYDVIILLDVDPDGLPAGYPELFERFVGRHRGGLLYIAGEKYSVRFFRSQAMKPVVDMMPVVADLARAEAEVGRTPFHERAWPIAPTRVASSHAATRLSSRVQRNRERWAEIASAYWSFPVRKAKPGATVLLVHTDPARALEGTQQPVLAWQYYEGGRVLFSGIDETWSWRATTEEVYDQYWIQTVRYLTETRLSGGKRKILQTDSDIYDLGDVARVSALLLDENYKPLEVESQVVTVEHESGTTAEVELKADSAAPGWYRSVFVPRDLGDYTLRLPDGTEHVLHVEPPDLEFQRPQLDESTLKELAGHTGGTYSRIWEAAGVPAKISDRRQTVVTTDEPVPLWDNAFSMALLVGLLSVEWILRKLNRLL